MMRRFGSFLSCRRGLSGMVSWWLIGMVEGIWIGADEWDSCY